MKLEGDIGEINVIERLVELGRERFTGAVRFENDGIIKIIYFKEGDILSASTNDRADSVDEILLKANKVTREHVKQALSRRKENETLGDALLNLGFITRKELSWGRRVQAIGAIRSINEWGAGTYNIVADYLPKREEGTVFSLTQIILELIVTDNDRAKFDRALDGGNVVFDRSADFDEQLPRLGFNDEAEQIVAQVNGERNASEVSIAAGKDAFSVYKLLHALATLGVLTRKPQGEPQFSLDVPSEDFASVGVADASDQWSAPADASSFATEDLPAPSMSWDESPAADLMHDDAPELVHPEEPATSADIASWGSTPMSVPAPPLEPEEPQWGFDEAQIEAARRVSVPVSRTEKPRPPMKQTVKKAAKPNRWIGALIGSVVIIAVAFAGLAGWNWYQGKNEPPPAPPVKRPVRRVLRPAPAAVMPTETITMPTQTTATVSGTNGTVATTTTAPAPIAATTTTIKPAPQPVPAVAVRTTPVETPHIERPAAGSATITNTAAPASNDATRAHYDEMARTFTSQASGSFTVQFELVCQTASLTKAIQEGGRNVWFMSISYRNQGCYRVFWGHYATRAEAERALSEIPVGLRTGSKPTVVTVPRQ